MSQAGRFVSGSSGSGTVETLTGNTGGAVSPDVSGNINVIGSGSLTVTGNPGANTLTISIVAPLTVAEGGTGATSLTDHGVLIGSGTSPVTVSAVGTNGQVFLGATGADPAFATLTSSNGSIVFSTGANSLDLTVNGGGAGLVDGIIPDSGTSPVVPDGSGDITLTGGTTGLTFVGGTNTVTLQGTLVVADGGTGNTTFTAYSLITAGTTATGAFQNVSGVGTSGQVLASNGAGMLPSWQDISATGAIDGIIPDSGTSPVVPDGSGDITLTGGTTGLTFVGGTNTVTLDGDLIVANGGTGNTTFTAYSVITAGTTATGAFQNVSGVGTSGQILTSNGASMLPSWQDAPSSTVITITALDNGDSPYTVLSTDVYMSCDVSGGVLEIDLPNAPSTGRVYYVKDSGGDAATNNITITTVGGAVTIDGATTFVMNTNYESVNLIFNGTSYEIW